MEKCKFVIPGAEHADEAVGFASEFRQKGELVVPGSNGLVSRLDSFSDAINRANYQSWWPELAAKSRLPLTDETVPNETYFLMQEVKGVGGRIVGVANIRTMVDARLWRGDGVIQFSIRPSERGQHYADAALLSALLVAWLRGMKLVPVAHPKGSVLQKLFQRLGARKSKEEMVGETLMYQYVLDTYVAMNQLWKEYSAMVVELPKSYF